MKLIPIYVIEAAAFLLIIAETYIFFEFVAPVGQIPHNLPDYTALALVKLVLVAGLGILWFAVVIGLTRLYIRSKVRNVPRPSS